MVLMVRFSLLRKVMPDPMHSYLYRKDARMSHGSVRCKLCFQSDNLVGSQRKMEHIDATVYSCQATNTISHTTTPQIYESMLLLFKDIVRVLKKNNNPEN